MSEKTATADTPALSWSSRTPARAGHEPKEAHANKLLTVAAALGLLCAVACDRDGTDRILVASDGLGDVAIHYYIGPDSCVMEIWVPASIPPDTGTAPEPDSGWTEVTLAELDSLGMMAPSMAEAQATQAGYASEVETDGYKYSSYLNCSIIHGKKHVMAGSRTERPLCSPGWMRVACTFRVNNGPFSNATSRYELGWRIYVQPKPSTTDPGNVWYYQVFGLHKYNLASGWPYSSYVERVF